MKTNKEGSATQSFRIALAKLDHRERKRYLFQLAFQTFLSLLDILSIAILALVASTLGNDSTTNFKSSNFLSRILQNQEIITIENRYISFILVTIALCFFVTKSVIATYITRLNLRSLSKIALRKSMELTKSFFETDILTLRLQPSQKIAAGLSSGVNALYLETLGSLMVLASEGFLLVLILVALFLLNFWVTIVALLYFGSISYILQKKILRISRKSGAIKYSSGIAEMQLIQDDIESFREIYVSGNLNLEIEKIRKVRVSAIEGLVNWQWVNFLPKYVMEISMMLGIFLIAAFEIFSESGGKVGVIAIFLIASSRILPSILRIQQAMATVTSTQPVILNLLEIERSIDTSKHNSNRVMNSNQKSKGKILFEAPKISLKEVSFSYNKAVHPVIKNISLQVNKGEFIGITGASGSGKSTLIDLMLGILTPSNGEIKVADLSPREAVSNYPGAIGYVPQKSRLLNSTLVENISQSDASISTSVRDQRVWDLLEMLKLTNQIKKFPNGIYENLGEHGSKLSGGQLQRISLARALYHEPKLLILDEATNALDARTEQVILEALLHLKSEMTIVMVAHRISMLKNCDQLYLLQDGEVAGQGDFESLKTKNKDFKEIVLLQQDIS